MKKITTAIIASAIYMIIGFLVSLSCLVDQSSLRGKSYNYEFSIIDQIADGIKDFCYSIVMFSVGVPSLIAGLTAGTLACISLHIYNKNWTETPACKVLSILSLCILCSITSIYIIGIIGIFILSL